MADAQNDGRLVTEGGGWGHVREQEAGPFAYAAETRKIWKALGGA
jgi:hypothetical protein